MGYVIICQVCITWPDCAMQADRSRVCLLSHAYFLPPAWLLVRWLPLVLLLDCTASVTHGPDCTVEAQAAVQQCCSTAVLLWYSSAAVQRCCLSADKATPGAVGHTSCLRVLTFLFEATTRHLWVGQPSAEPVQAVLTSTAVSTTFKSNVLVRLHHVAGAVKNAICKGVYWFGKLARAARAQS